MSWSKILLSDIDAFHPIVGGMVEGATLNASSTCVLSASYTARLILHAVL